MGLLFDDATPLYLQLAARLKSEIESGQRATGEKLPTEFALSDSFHVSRVTVRKALALLEEDGYIERRIGKGTYVRQMKLQRNLSGRVLSFTRMCEQMGCQASSKTLRVLLEQPSEEEARLMKLNSRDQVLLVDRVRYCSGSPVMLERDLFPEEFSFLKDEDLDKNSLYALVQSQKQISFSDASRSIDVTFADKKEAALLNIKVGYPLLRIVSVTTSEDGQVTTLSEQKYIGDKFKLQV